MKHVFQYQPLDGWYRPLISIKLRLEKIEIEHLALLDSGADFNIFHSNTAALLGIDIKKLKRWVSFVGVNGQESKGHYTAIDIGIAGHFVNTPVIFSSGMGQAGFGVLGQRGFFDKYDVHFKYRKKKIIIED